MTFTPFARAAAGLAACTLFAGASADTIVRTTSYEIDALTGLRTKETIEPSTPNNCLATTYSYDKFGNRLLSSSAICSGATGTSTFSATAARATNWTFSADGRFIATVRNPASQTDTRTFDARFGTLTSQKDPNNLTTQWTYDGFGRRTRESRPDGTYTTWDYLHCTESGAACTSPAAWVLVQTPYASNAVASGAAKRTYYDAAGRVVRVQTAGFDGSGANTTILQDTRYDALGRISAKTAPYDPGVTGAQWTTYSYDALGRITRETRPEPGASNGTAATTTEYQGLTTKVTNARSQVRTTRRDSQGQVVEVSGDPAYAVTSTYNAAGQLVQTNAGGVLTQMTYDIRGNRKTVADRALGLWEYEYNPFGELVWQSNGQGKTTTLAYDLLGRMTKRTEADLVSDWSWDKKLDGTTCGAGIGKLCEAKADNGYRRTHTYDTAGRLSATSTALDTTATFTLTYDNAGRIASTTWPTGYSAAYTYSPLGYLSKITGGGTAAFPQATSMQVKGMTARGQVDQFVYGSGIGTGRTYETGAGRLMSQAIGTPASPSIATWSWTYDALGNVGSRYDSLGAVMEVMAYDQANRLTKVTASGGSVSGLQNTQAMYDVRGNIAYRSDTGKYAYDAQRPDRLTGVTLETAAGASVANTGTRKLTYGYDDAGGKSVGGVTLGNGNLTYTLSQDAANSRNTVRWETYTSFNMPKDVKWANATSTTSPTSLPTTAERTLSFVYGPEHQRVKEVVQLGSGAPAAYKAGTTWYAHGEDSLGLSYEKEVRTSGLVENRHFLRLDGQVFAVFVTRTGTLGTLPATATQYIHTDNLGSIVGVTNESGGLVELMAYDPWGKRRNTNGTADKLDSLVPASTDRGYTLHEHLDEVGLVHMNGRVYDPVSGRFMSADPYIPDPNNLQAYNRYAYVQNNPLTLTDPTGYNWEPFSPSGSTYFGGGSSFSTSIFDLNPLTATPLLAGSPGGLSSALGSIGTLNGGFFGGQSGGVFGLGGTTASPSGSSFAGDFMRGWNGNVSVMDGSAGKSWTQTAGSFVRANLLDLPSQVPMLGGFWDYGRAALNGDGPGMLIAAGSVALDVASFGTAGTALRAEKIAAKAIPQVADTKLGNIVRDLYKGAKMPAPVGTGSTADAIRSELATGLPTAGRFHSQKGAQYINALDNWLQKNPTAAHYDRMVADSLKNDLASALGRK